MKENEYKVSGIVEKVQPSTSGKSLSVKVGDKWFSTKEQAIWQFVGKSIEGAGSDSEYKGKTMHWLNEFVAGQGGMYQNAPQAPQSAPAGTPAQAAPPATPQPWDHRERSIFIQSLCRHWIAPEDTPAQVREKVQFLFKLVDEAELWAKFS